MTDSSNLVRLLDDPVPYICTQKESDIFSLFFLLYKSNTLSNQRTPRLDRLTKETGIVDRQTEKTFFHSFSFLFYLISFSLIAILELSFFAVAAWLL